ncbi:MAG: beta strand repeat-containing protein [Desulfobaccales bacterium]
MKNKFSLISGVLMIAAALALLPLTAQAVTYTWNDGNDFWDITTDWTGTAPTGGPSGTSNTATISNGTSTTPVTVTLRTSPAKLGTLNIGNAFNTLSINSGDTFSANSIVMSGGSLTGTGTVASPISGYGTVSSITGLTTLTANNATYGNALSINNVTQPGAVTLAFSSKGTFNLSNVTLGATGNTGTILGFSGSTTYSQFTNPLPGTFGNNWGNVDYGLANVTGNTTLNGGISLSNYYVLNITNSTLTVNNPGTITGFNTSSPPVFVLGTGGNLILTGNTALGNSAPIPINGGSLTHTGGTFSAYSFIGNGSISGVTTINGGGNVTASGGTLTFNGGTGVNMGASGSGANLNSSTGSTLDLQGAYTYLNSGFIAPSGGTINFDNATFNAGTTSPTLSAGTINVTNNSVLTSGTGGSFSSSATLGIGSGITLDASGATFTNNGTVNVTGGTAKWGNFTNNGAYNGDPSTNTFNNLTVASTGFLTGVSGDVFQINGNFTNNSTQTGSWNTSAAMLKFAGGGTHTFTLAAGGSPLNSWGTLDLASFVTGENLALAGPSGAALYVGVFSDLLSAISGGAVTNVTGNGFNIFYDPTLAGNAYLMDLTYNLGNGGFLEPLSSPVPIPPSAMLLGTGLLGLAGLGWRRRKVSQA